MKTKRIWRNILITFLFILCAWSLSGAEEDNKIGDVNIPPEMDILKQGDVNVMVPKGERLRKQNDVTLIEDTDIYAARNFSKMEDHFKEIEKELEAQKKELEKMREIIDSMQQKKRPPQHNSSQLD